MISSLIIVAVLLLLWARIWQKEPKLAFGIFLGLPLAWVCYKLIEPHLRGVYVTGMDNIPVWLPMLPLAIVAITLLVFGGLIWFRSDKFTLPPRNDEDADHH